MLLWRDPIFLDITYSTATTVAERRSQQTPHRSPVKARYGVSVVRVLEKIDCFNGTALYLLQSCRMEKILYTEASCHILKMLLKSPDTGRKFDGNTYTGKMTSLYWISPPVPFPLFWYMQYYWKWHIVPRLQWVNYLTLVWKFSQIFKYFLFSILCRISVNEKHGFLCFRWMWKTRIHKVIEDTEKHFHATGNTHGLGQNDGFTWKSPMHNKQWGSVEARIHGWPHWSLEKMAAVLQTAFINVFSGIEMFEFWLKFIWNLFVRDQFQ